MIKLTLLLLTLNFYPKQNMKEIYRFSAQSNLREWRIVNDGVMGGISKSNLLINNEGYRQFSGLVSLENNGGFVSVRI